MFTALRFKFAGSVDARFGRYQGAFRFLARFGSNPARSEGRQETTTRFAALKNEEDVLTNEKHRQQALIRQYMPWLLTVTIFLVASSIELFAAIGIVRAIGAPGLQRLFLSIMLAFSVYLLTAVVRRTVLRANDQPAFTHVAGALVALVVYVGLIYAVAVIRYAELLSLGESSVGASIAITIALTAGPGWVMDFAVNDFWKQLPLLRAYWDSCARLRINQREEHKLQAVAIRYESWLAAGVKAMAAYNIAYNHVAGMRNLKHVAPEDAGWPPEILQAAYITIRAVS